MTIRSRQTAQLAQSEFLAVVLPTAHGKEILFEFGDADTKTEELLTICKGHR